MNSLVKQLISAIRNPELPFSEFESQLSFVSGRISADMGSLLSECLRDARKGNQEFPSLRLSEIIKERYVIECAPLLQTAQKYSQGLQKFEWQTLKAFLESYIQVETLFNTMRYEDALLYLRDQQKDDLEQAVDIVISHAQVARSKFILAILDALHREPELSKDIFQSLVSTLADFKRPHTAKVSLKARELLILYQLPSYQNRYGKILSHLENAVADENGLFDYTSLSSLIMTNESILDILPSFFYHPDVGIRAVALYTYVLHTYQAYSVSLPQHQLENEPVIFQWNFVLRSSMQPVQSSHKTLSLQRPAGSFSDLRAMNFDSATVRKGLICAFKSFEEMESQFYLIQDACHGSPSNDTHRNEPMNVMNIAVLTSDKMLQVEDEEVNYQTNFS